MNERTKPKTEKKMKIPGFEIDPETNQYVAVAFKYDDYHYAFFGEDRPDVQDTKRENHNGYCKSKGTSSKKTASQTSSSYRKNIKSSAEGTEGSQPSKYRKSTLEPRKELFRVSVEPNNKASKESTQPRCANSRVKTNSVEPHKPLKIPSMRTKIAKFKAISQSRIPELESAAYGGTPSKSFYRPPAIRSPMTPGRIIDLQDSLCEFLTLEQQCLSVKKPPLTKDSHISTICNLFENSLLIDATKENAPASDTLIEIRRLIHLEQKRLESSLQEFLEQNRASKENLDRINVLVNKLEQQVTEQVDEDKENSGVGILWTSQNIHSLNPIISQKNVQAIDLRKETLTKNLMASCHNNQLESTHTKFFEQNRASKENLELINVLVNKLEQNQASDHEDKEN